MEIRELPEGWQWQTLNDPKVCILNPKKSEISSLPNDLEVTFVPMAAVDDVTGTIIAPEIRELGEVRKGYTYFSEGDVVFAKITPCMENGKSAVAQNLRNSVGLGTTEFHVLRPGPLVIPEWIHAFLRSVDFRDAARKSMRGGAGQQRVPIEFLQQTRISIPSILEQRRIIARIKELTSRIRQAIAIQDEATCAVGGLFQTGLESAFSERDIADWPVYETKRLFSPVSGQVDPREEPYVDMPHIGPDSIESGTGRLFPETIQTPRQLGLKSGKYLFGPEHVLYSKIRPALRKVALPDFSGVCSADMYPLLPNTDIITREFLALSLLSPDFSQYAIDNSDRNAMPKINRKTLFACKMAVPDKIIQKQITDELFGMQKKSERLAEMQRVINEELNSLTPALLAKAFRGEL